MEELKEEEKRLEALITRSIEHEKSINEMQDALDEFEEACAISSEQPA